MLIGAPKAERQPCLEKEIILQIWGLNAQCKEQVTKGLREILDAVCAEESVQFEEDLSSKTASEIEALQDQHCSVEIGQCVKVSILLNLLTV